MIQIQMIPPYSRTNAPGSPMIRPILYTSLSDAPSVVRLSNVPAGTCAWTDVGSVNDAMCGVAASPAICVCSWPFFLFSLSALNFASCSWIPACV